MKSVSRIIEMWRDGERTLCQCISYDPKTVEIIGKPDVNIHCSVLVMKTYYDKNNEIILVEKYKGGEIIYD